jgi:diguanylate cyclase (GGDEF)-like protein
MIEHNASQNSILNQSFAQETDENIIDQKVDLQLNEMQMKMVKVGGITNILAGIFVVFVLRNQASFANLALWYGALVTASILELVLAYGYSHSKTAHFNIKPWIGMYHCLLGVVCFVWGSMAVVFANTDAHSQLYIITFLQVVLFGFTIGTITDYTATVVSVVGLLLPYICFSLYTLIDVSHRIAVDARLYYIFSFSLVILGAFLLVTCFIGYKEIKKSYKLSLLNLALNKKLENMNKFLEHRVKERTMELENSLKLVTYQATHDLLTDLPNQRLLLENMDTAITAATQGNHMFGVIMFSLNEIEKINDGLGYQAGDTVIRTVAQRFRNIFALDSFHSVRYMITLSRKDIFVILLDPIFRLEEVEKRVEALFAVLEDAIHTEKQALKLTASVGVSLYPGDGKDIKALLMNADAAMLDAKKHGGNTISIYQAEINADISKQLELEKNLHTALRNNEFTLQYQPVVELKTGRICACEALVRWNNPSLGYVPPDSFIPIAEANGVIVSLGEWVLRTACQQTKLWQDKGFRDLRVAVNISAKQLIKKNIVQRIVEILTETQLKPEFLELELTESIAFQDEVLPVLKQFKEMGIGLSIDDFGTGYSSLTNIKLFSLDTLKIDKSFIQDVEGNSDSRAIVANTIMLAKKVNVRVIAEGAETKEQIEFLKECDCDMIQGYYFSQPVSEEGFTNLLEKHVKFDV